MLSFQKTYEEAFNHCGFPLALTSGTEHLLVLANPEFQERFSRGCSVGNTILQAFVGADNLGLSSILDKVYKTGERVLLKEKIITRNFDDGSTESFVLDFTFTPVRDTKAAVVGIIIVIMDRTESFQITKQLIENECRLIKFLDCLPQLTFFSASRWLHRAL